MHHIINNDQRNFEYNELRNDPGIHFEYEWDRDKKIIIIKRNNNNFPIVRVFFFDNKNFNTIIKL